jgi:signal transduction histidine kinase
MCLQRERGERFSRFLFCVLIVFSVPSVALDVPAAEPQKAVLALYGSRPDLPSNLIVDEIIRSTLERELGPRLDFYTEFLDTARWPEGETQVAVHDFLRRRYAQRKLSAIIAVARPAINFMRIYGDELFPGVPIIAYGDSDALRDWGPGRPITGTLAKIDLSRTVDLILQLQPGTREILVISGASDSDRWRQSEARRQLDRLEKTVKLTYMDASSVQDFVRTVARVPDGTVILFLSMYQDSAGNKLLSHEVLARIAKEARVPVYNQTGTNVGLGIVGGVVFDPEILGRETAQLTLRVLRGERLQDLPVQESKSTVPVVDWRQLRRWGLDEKRLPVGTVVRFREASVWQTYKWYILSFLAAMILELLLIATLFVEVRKRRTSENALKELSGRLIHAAEEERQRLARELHDDFQQRLALLSVGLDMACQESPSNGTSLHQQLKAMAKDVQELAGDVHNLSHRLHSSKLQVLGLKAALKEVCRQVSHQHNVDIQLQADELSSKLSDDLSLCFYRIAQEALNNAVKHSHSPRIEVKLGNSGGRVWMRIKDFGVGFDATVRANGIGLAAMRERLRMVGGSLQVKSSPGVGTDLTAEAKVVKPDISSHAA